MFEEFEVMRHKVDQFITELEDIAKEDHNEKFCEQLGSLKSDLNSVRYTIAIIGFMKRGKSTLINTILRRKNDEISPVRSGTCTSAITRYRPVQIGETAGEADIVFKDPSRKLQTVKLHQLRDYIDNDRNLDNTKGVRYIDVRDTFPILNNSVMLVDTPGMGSLYREHDTLTLEFLPQADAIILPIASDMLVDQAEKDFLRQLPQHEKDHIFVVITKCDEIRSEKDRNDVEYATQTKLADVDIRYERLYWTTAKPVFNALKEGRPEEEIEQLMEENGLKDLESDLERHILEKSEKNGALIRRFRIIMDAGQVYQESRMVEVLDDLHRFDQNYGELQAELKELRGKAETLRKERNKKLSAFNEEWNRHVTRFKNTLTSKDSRIVDSLIARFDKDGLLQAVRRRPLNLVAAAVEEETRSIVQELTDKLDDTVRKLTEDFIGDLEVYVGRKGGLDKTATIYNLTGGAATVVTGLWSTGQFMSAVSSVTGAIASIPVANAAAANASIVAKAWSLVFGASSTSATGVAASATAHAISTAMSAIPQMGLAVGAAWLVHFITKEGLGAFHQGRLNELTSEKLQEVGEEIGEKLELKRGQISEDFTASIEDLIRNTENRLAEVADAVKQQDPMKKVSLEIKHDKLLSLQNDYKELRQEIQQYGYEGRL